MLLRFFRSVWPLAGPQPGDALRAQRGRRVQPSASGRADAPAADKTANGARETVSPRGGHGPGPNTGPSTGRAKRGRCEGTRGRPRSCTGTVPVPVPVYPRRLRSGSHPLSRFPAGFPTRFPSRSYCCAGECGPSDVAWGTKGGAEGPRTQNVFVPPHFVFWGDDIHANIL